MIDLPDQTIAALDELSGLFMSPLFSVAADEIRKMSGINLTGKRFNETVMEIMLLGLAKVARENDISFAQSVERAQKMVAARNAYLASVQ